MYMYTSFTTCDIFVQILLIEGEVEFKCNLPVTNIWVSYFIQTGILQHVAASTGTGENDLMKLKEILDAVPEVKYLCVDVANGYSEHFVQFVKNCRQEFPTHTIMVNIILFHWLTFVFA